MISRLSTDGFRILDKFNVTFKPNLNVISGPNASGKTSILESIGYCIRGKSVLGSKDSDVVTFNKDRFNITLETEAPARKPVNVMWHGRKTICLGDQPIRRARDLLSIFKMVFICPKTVSIALGSPSGRRDFLDETASQINPEWASLITEYRATIKDRNSLLSRDSCDPNLLDVLSNQIIEKGTKLRRIRKLVVEDIRNLIRNFNVDIHIDDTKELSSEAFQRKRKIEMIRGRTLIGPHLDDCHFSLSGNSVDRFASTGEARRVIIILKLTQARIIQRRSGIEPFILADDILAELDSKNSIFALNELSKFSQVILTNAGANPTGEYNLIEVGYA